jgi:hypothetical protein
MKKKGRFAAGNHLRSQAFPCYSNYSDLSDAQGKKRKMLMTAGIAEEVSG